jgi:hypothetical protein
MLGYNVPLKINRRFGGTCRLLFLLTYFIMISCLALDPEDGGDTALYPRR